MSRAEQKRQEQAEAREWLQDMIKPGQTVYTVLRHVSRSGMSRIISLYIKNPHTGGMRCIDHHAARLMDWSISSAGGTGEGIKVGGCGMDMGFHLVYSLGWGVYPAGYRCPGEGKKTGRRCQHNSHYNNSHENPRKAGVKHEANGDVFEHRWL